MIIGKYCLWLLLLIAASLSDIKHYKISNSLILTGYLLLLAFESVIIKDVPYYFVTTTTISTVIMIILSLITKGKLGMGDAKFTLITSGYLGLYYWFVSLFIASALALAFTLPFIFTKKCKITTPIPFAPFLSINAIVALWLKTEGVFAP